jgi:hypothetical protein
MKYDFKGLVLLGALIGTAACSSDRLQIPNYNAPTVDGVGKDPQGIQLSATGIIERERALQPGTSQDFGFFGRESYIYFPTDGRNVTGFLVGVPGFGGKTLDPGGFAATTTNWNSRFANMRNVKNFLAAVDGSTLTDVQKKAANGFAKTIRGLDMKLLYSRDTLGAPLISTNRVTLRSSSAGLGVQVRHWYPEEAKADLLAQVYGVPVHDAEPALRIRHAGDLHQVQPSDPGARARQPGVAGLRQRLLHAGARSNRRVVRDRSRRGDITRVVERGRVQQLQHGHG